MSSDFVEISVKVSDDVKSLVQKFPCYETITLSHDDPHLSQMVDETMKSFKDEAQEVVVKIKYMW